MPKYTAKRGQQAYKEHRRNARRPCKLDSDNCEPFIQWMAEQVRKKWWSLDTCVGHDVLERLFKLQEKNTSVKTEILAGVTTFIALAYILFINPNILADAGIPKEAASAATIWIAALSSMAMGIFANYPVAMESVVRTLSVPGFLPWGRPLFWA